MFKIKPSIDNQRNVYSLTGLRSDALPAVHSTSYL